MAGIRAGLAGLKRENWIGLLQAFALTILVALLFYKSLMGILAGVVIVPFWYSRYMQEQARRGQVRLENEFKEYMMLISSSLQAGYSLERAIKNSQGELAKLFADSRLLPHVATLNKRIDLNTQVEQAFEMFANEVNIEEAVSLSEILSYSKRSGGDYSKHIKNTARKIDEKLAVKQEIETITTEKRLELKVMCAMPLGILAYVSLTSGDFIAPLYGNLVGAAVMTVLLLIYGVMIELGQSIININV